MRLKKTTDRRKRQVIKKVIFLGGVGGIVLLSITAIIVYKIVFDSHVPFISPLSSEVVAAWAQNRDKKTELESIFKKEHIDFSKVSTAQNSTIKVILPNEEEVLMSSDKDLNIQVASLQVIVSRLTMEGKRFKKLDLRFDKPVISL